MKICFAYVRVSTARQSDQGTSPQEQRHAITGYALRHGLEISGWYEEHESAAKQGRPEFTRMMRDMRRRRVSGIIMHKIDRGARNLKDWATLLDVADAGIEIHFAHDSVDLTSRGGRLTANIQAVMAADYSRNLSDEVKKGQLGRLRQGFYPLRAPRGYLDCGKAKPKEVDPIQGPLVRETFERYASGAYGLDTLRREMAGRGLCRRGGSPISRGSMATLLHNPFYIGLMRLGPSGEVFTGNHQPLVTRALFDYVQDMLAGKCGAKIQKHDFLFRRRLRCSTCNRRLPGELQKGRIYYRCHAPDCRGTSVREDILHRTIRTNLSLLQLMPGEVGDFRDVLRELIAQERQGEGAYRRQLGLEIAKLDERVSRLTDLLMDGTVDKEAYLSKKEELLLNRRSMVDLQEQGSEDAFWVKVQEKLELGFTALLRYESRNIDEKRLILDSVSSNLFVRQKEPVLTMLFPLAEWAEWTKLHQCAHSQATPRTRVQIRQFLEDLRRDVAPSPTSGKVEGHDPSNPPSRRYPF